jgi:glycerol-3-phosphate acyltransferase PlsY
LAGVVFLLELAKGFLPTLTGYLALGTPGAVGGGSAALVGHNFPFFGRLRGSNSVAPLLGVLLAVYPIVVVILGMVWTATLAAWRYASLAALVAATVSPLALAALDAGAEDESLVVWAAVLWSLLVFFAHRENIRRLMSGREAKIDAPFSEGRRRIR